ncbi:Present in the outer mitochondrial membrane proteome 7 [Trypanosoma cruzi]|nr:Present in the outer mitochondrial membrane proteome 7 [Trypanosoma cruzi]
MLSSSSSSGTNMTRLIAGGILLFIFAAYRQMRRVPSLKEKGASKTQSLKDLSSSTPRAAQAVPVEVVVEKLPDGWSAAPPIYYPPYLAAIPFLHCKSVKEGVLSEKNNFIVCDGSRLHVVQEPRGTEELVAFYTQYIQDMPILKSIGTNGAAVRPLKEVGFSCESGCFTHAVVIPEEEIVIAFGRNGPYILSFVFTKYLTSPLRAENEKDTVEKLNSGDLQMLLDACRLVPLVDGVRLPGTPVGSQRGCLRLKYQYGGHMLVFSLPSSVSVRTNEEKNKKGNKGASDALFVLEGDVLPGNKIVVGSAALDAIVKGTSIDALFPLSAPGCPPLSSLLSLDAVEESASPIADGATDHATRPREEDAMNVVFSHEYLGVSFSVNPKNGFVYEPILTEDLLLLYYPLGDEAHYAPPSGQMRNVAPPRFSVRRVTQLSPLWEKFVSTEDELKHNVLFHFTDWTKEQVPCSLCDISGFKGIQLFESKEGHSCRSYVIPRADSILVVRWETETKDWDMHLPLLQKFLDTLHLADPLA